MSSIYQWFQNLIYGSTGGNIDGGTKFLFWVLLVCAIGLGWCLYMLVYSLIDSVSSYEEESHGVVVDKSHKEDTQSTNIGFGPTSNGGVATVVTTSGSPEEWNFIVRENGTNQIFKIETNMQCLYDTPIGSKLTIVKKIGGISHSLLNSHVTDIKSIR